MLKNIPSILSPDLLKVLMEMGHGDKIVIADGNFPSANCAKRLIRCDGHNVPELLEAILKLFPLDTYSSHPVQLMGVVPGDIVVPTIWEDYATIIKNEFNQFDSFEFIERFDFYNHARDAYAVISTSEKALYANIILTKGVV